MSTFAPKPAAKRARADDSDSSWDDSSDSDSDARTGTTNGAVKAYASAAGALCVPDASGRAMLANWEASLQHLAVLIEGPPGLESAPLPAAPDAEFGARIAVLAHHEELLSAAFGNLAMLGKQLRDINAQKAQRVVDARARAKATRDGTMELAVHVLHALLVDTAPEVRAKAWTRVGTVAAGVKSGCQHHKACMLRGCLFAAEDVLPRTPVALLNFHDASHTLCLTLCERCITVSNVGFLLEQHGAKEDASGATRGKHTEDSVWELYKYNVRVAASRLVPTYMEGRAATLHDLFSLRKAAKEEKKAGHA